MKLTQTFAILMAALCWQGGPLPAQNVWNLNGSAGNPNWSSGGNWGFVAVPNPGDNVLFDIYGFTSAPGVVNNVVDTSFTISTLGYSLVTTNGYHTTQINPGQTLSVVPQGSPPVSLAVGEWAQTSGSPPTPSTNGPNDLVVATVLGTGTLTVNGAGSAIRVEESYVGASGSHWATLNMSNLNTFTATVNNLLIGADWLFFRPAGTLILAQTNTITTSPGTTVPGIFLGCGGNTANDGGSGILTLGQANILNCDWVAVGGHRANQTTSTLSFGSTNGTLTMRGSAGGSTRAPLITIGDQQASDIPIAQQGLNGTSRGAIGVATFSGNTVDILANSLILGRNMTTNEASTASGGGGFNTGATGVATGTLTFDTGTIDVNNLYLGYKIGTNYGGASGTLNANGGTLNVHSSVLMTTRPFVNGGFNGGNPSATLTIASNAVANVQGDIIKGTSGQGSATLNVNFGGLLNLQPAGRAGNVTLDSLTINGGTLVNASNVTVSGGTVALTSTTLTNAGGSLTAATLTLNTNATVLNITNISLTAQLNLNNNSAVLNASNITVGTTLNLNGGNITNGQTLTAATITGSGTLANVANVTNGTSLLPGSTDSAGTITVGGNLTLKTNASLAFALSSATTTGGGVNSYVNVGGNLTFLATNVLSIEPLGTISAGPYRLVDYAGALTGAPVFTNTTRYSLALDLSTPHQINLNNSGGSPVSLTWKGSTALGGTNWTYLTTTNWNNQTQPFYQDDPVTFDANGVTTAINASGLLYPQSIAFNDSRTYSIIGSGKISGNAGITMNGSGTLLVATTGGNDFNGAIVVNSGVLKAGNAGALGSTNGTTTIASGAALDLNGTNCNSPGEYVIVSGTGIGGTGAITNSAGDVNNNGGLRYVSLAGDASTGVNLPGRWDIRGSLGNGTFSGGLYLNGFTYTKTGPGKHELADTICTTSGNLVNNGGILAFTRSIVDGPGTITTFGTNMLLLENNTVGMVAKPLIFRDTSMFQLTGNSFVLSSPVTNLNTGAAGLTIDIASGTSLTMTNVLTGSGAVTKTSAGNLVLQAPDLCTGPTVIVAGGIVLNSAASMPNTPSITLNPGGTTLDVSTLSGLTLGGAQTLAGSGTVLGNLATSTGTTLIPGNSIGTLTVSGNLAMNNTTNQFELGTDPTQIGNGGNDLIAVGQNLTLGGLNTFKITPVGALDTATPYTLITYPGALSGALANVTASSANPRYTFSMVNPATTPGSIQVSVAGNPVTLTWHGGQAGNPTLWNSGNTGTSNWLNGALADVFYTGDTITFDDTAISSSVTFTNTVQPGAMTVNNSSLNYTFSGAGSLVAGSFIKTGTSSVTLSDSGTNIFTTGITLNQGTLALNLPATNMTFPAVLSDDGGGQGTLQKLGTNVMTLNGNNSAYNGAILVSAGTLKVANANSLGTVNGGTTVAGGATLDVNGQNLGLEPITAGGAGVGGLGAIYNSGGNQNNATRFVTLTDNTTFGGNGRWDIRGADATVNAGTLSTSGNAYNVTKVGTNQVSWVNVAVDDALGNIDVQKGLFSIEHGTVSPNTRGIGDPSKTLTIFTNATLQINQLDNPLDKVIVMNDGASITNQGAAAANTISSGITLNGTNNIAVGAGTTLSLSGANSLSGYALNGTGSLIVNAPTNTGTFNLYSANNWSGGMLISGGTVAIDNSLSFTANKNIVVTTTTGGGGNTGTRITLGITAGGAWTIPPGVSVNLPSSQPGDLRSGLFANKGTTEWQGPIICYAQAGAVTPGSVQLSSDASTSVFTVSGPISGVLTNLILRGNNQGIGKVYGPINVTNPGGLPPRLEKTELSLWTLYTNNNVWGDTIVHEGILQLGTNNALPVTGFLTIGQQAFPCVFDLNGFNQQVTGLGSDVNPAYQFVGNSSTTSDSTLTILGTNVTTYAGSIMDQAPTWDTTNFFGSQRLGLTLAAGNMGSLTLGGTNSYTGPTLLNGGKLLVNGSLSNTVVTVNNGAFLGGTGVISGPVTVNTGGTLTPGDSPGTLTISNNLTLASGSTTLMEFTLSTMTRDQVVGVSALTYGGTLVVSNIGTIALSGGTSLKLFDAAAYSGAFASIVPAQPGPGMVWDTSSLTVNGTLNVVALPPMEFQSFGVLGNGNFQMTFSGPSGSGYRVWATNNPALTPVTGTWSLLSSGTFGATPVTFTDTQATSFSRRFYEITVP